MSEKGTRRQAVLGLVLAVIPLLVALVMVTSPWDWFHDGGVVVAPGPVVTSPPQPVSAGGRVVTT
jgi:hypothetical protein